MRYRPFGRTDLSVSEVGLGCRGIGGGFGTRNDKESRRMVERAIELGATYIDATVDRVDPDASDHAEGLLGEVLGAKRDRVILASTVVAPADASLSGERLADALRGAIAEKLRRLRTDRLDVVWIAPRAADGPGAEDDALGRLAAGLEPLREAGLFRAAGWSAADLDGAMAATRHDAWDALCVPVSLLDSTCAPAIAAAADRGMGVAVRQPLLSGFMAGKYLDASRFKGDDPRRHLPLDTITERSKRSQEFRFLCIGERPSLSQCAVSAVMAEPGVSVVVVGARTKAQLDETFAASTAPAIADDALEAARRLSHQFAVS